jgi:hypothetical protein
MSATQSSLSFRKATVYTQLKYSHFQMILQRFFVRNKLTNSNQI